MSRCVNNQQHDMNVGEAETGVLRSIHKVYVSDESDLATDGSMSEVPLRFVPMRLHRAILMSYGEDSQETRLSSPDDDKDVPDILTNMLIKSQVPKENDDQVHEDVGDIGDSTNNHDHNL